MPPRVSDNVVTKALPLMTSNSLLALLVLRSLGGGANGDSDLLESSDCRSYRLSIIYITVWISQPHTE